MPKFVIIIAISNVSAIYLLITFSGCRWSVFMLISFPICYFTKLSSCLWCFSHWVFEFCSYILMSSAFGDILALTFYVLCNGRCYPVCFLLNIILWALCNIIKWSSGHNFNGSIYFILCICHNLVSYFQREIQVFSFFFCA